jgi:hypothetical protein
MELIDHFGEEILLQSYYEKFMESLVKKTVSVGDVIGHLCKVRIVVMSGVHQSHPPVRKHQKLRHLHHKPLQVPHRNPQNHQATRRNPQLPDPPAPANRHDPTAHRQDALIETKG